MMEIIRTEGDPTGGIWLDAEARDIDEYYDSDDLKPTRNGKNRQAQSEFIFRAL